MPSRPVHEWFEQTDEIPSQGRATIELRDTPSSKILIARLCAATAAARAYVVVRLAHPVDSNNREVMTSQAGLTPRRNGKS